MTVRTRLVCLCVLLLALPGFAQEKSVKPGINKSFESPDVPKFIERFEREGRDVFDHQKEILAALKLKPGMKVADVGAGTGLFARLMARRVGSCGKIYAVDISEEFLDHIRKTARAECLKNIQTVVCQPDSVELPPHSVDLVFICDTYHHFEYPYKTMRSIHEALKPGGEVVLIDFQRIEGVSDEWILGHVRAGQEVFTKEILDCGFEQIDEKPNLLDESYFVRFRKREKSESSAAGDR